MLRVDNFGEYLNSTNKGDHVLEYSAFGGVSEIPLKTSKIEQITYKIVIDYKAVLIFSRDNTGSEE